MLKALPSQNLVKMSLQSGLAMALALFKNIAVLITPIQAPLTSHNSISLYTYMYTYILAVLTNKTYM